jgi:hypothetical protein
MSRRKERRLKAAQQAGRAPSGRTRVLGVLAGGAVVAVFSAEAARIWRLGMLPISRQEHDDQRRPTNKAVQAVQVVREGYKVSRTRENSLFNMLAGFTTTFGITRWITWMIRTHGGIGPIKDVKVGSRHIHHFIPGGVLSLAAGGAAIGMKGSDFDRYLAIPFGVGVALVLDESALLLELEDVYWTEEGVLSVQIVFAAIAFLAAMAYLIRILRHTEEQDSEADWELAAKAWDDLQMIPGGSGGPPGIGL